MTSTTSSNQWYSKPAIWRPSSEEADHAGDGTAVLSVSSRNHPCTPPPPMDHFLLDRSLPVEHQLLHTLEIQRLNNEGIHLLQKGSFGAAIHHFRKALALVKRGLVRQGVTTSPSSQTIFLRYKTLPSRNSIQEDFLMNHSPHNIFPVFDSTFAVESSNPHNAPLDESDTTIALVFNYAIALHRWGLVQGRTQCLQKALELYDMCLDLCHTAQRLGRSLPLMIRLAALANKLSLLGHFGQTVDDTHGQLQHVLHSALCTPLLDHADLIFFLHVLVMCDHYVGQRPSAPAA